MFPGSNQQPLGSPDVSSARASRLKEKQLLRRVRRRRRWRGTWVVFTALITAGCTLLLIYLSSEGLHLPDWTTRQTAQTGSPELGDSIERSQLRPEAELAELKEILALERERAESLERELASGQSEIEALRARATAAQSAEAKVAELDEALHQERQRAERELASARSEIEALQAAAGAAQAAEAKSAELNEALSKERQRAENLTRDVASARSEVQDLRARATAAQSAEAKVAELDEALHQERQRAERELASARSEIEALHQERSRAVPSAEATAVKQRGGGSDPLGVQPLAANPPVTGGSVAEDPASRSKEPPGVVRTPDAAVATSSVPPDEEKLLTKAHSLLKLGDISGARLLLERAVAAGSAQAAFRLAETYDPRQLTRWRAHGVRGDWARAQALYARARSGGVLEAQERLAPPQ